ncbi:Phenolic glucoside malonyltransferase 1 [Acorus gramineus]|uniref:Phenolic glucoside malonyltransferase 1 n=1 Tax=Acorus gramineus TaxID=55184 RepID=A0AAV9AFI4_ACOGR|nr:Phenolic glucoside malonyltransferase 1 [Acorus gramineus]
MEEKLPCVSGVGSVRVIKFSKVTPTPPNPDKLSIFDHFLASTPPIKALLFFPTVVNPLNFPSIVCKLKESLSKALKHFHPLSGRLSWSPDSKKFEIIYDAQSSSTTFIEAECEEDFGLLVKADVHDSRVYDELAPPLNSDDKAMEVLSIQFTTFGRGGGGLVIGVSMHHVVADGRSYWSFVKSWAEICRTGGLEVVPVLDRSAVTEPDELTRLYEGSPMASSSWRSEPKSPHSQGPLLIRKTFILKQSLIQVLKERAGTTSNSKVSSFVAVCAHAWVCSTKARRVPRTDTTIFHFLVDCRPLLRPPLPETYFGNLITPCFVEAEASRLLCDDDNLAFAAATIQTAVRGVTEDPLRDCEAWPVWLAKTREPSRATLNVGSSPKFTAYEVNFGWGRPERIEFVLKDKVGTMVLADARDEVGGFQVCMVLPPSEMDEFSNLFMDGF